jgi:hypothetical protein
VFLCLCLCGIAAMSLRTAMVFGAGVVVGAAGALSAVQSVQLLRWLRWLVGLTPTLGPAPTLPDHGGVYGMRHLLLNVPTHPPTLWNNMGLWPDEDGAAHTDLPAAAEALARRVADAAGLSSTDNVLGPSAKRPLSLSLVRAH